MSIKNSIICPNCGAENDYYKETCSSCKAYLRAKIFNIDLWRIIWDLIESPLKAFKEIIFAEHKNYIIFIMLIMGFKYFLNSLIISNFINMQDPLNPTPFTLVFPAMGIFIALLLAVSFLFKNILNLTGYKNLYKNVTAVLTYSFIPSVLIFCILSPIEFAIFGRQWFYHNPSPFSLKRNAAFVLIGIEAGVFLWGCFLSIKGFNALTQNRMISILFGLIFSVIFIAGMFLLPFTF